MAGVFWFVFWLAVIAAAIAFGWYLVGMFRSRTDEQIRDELSGRLTQHIDIDSSRIDLEVSEGVVTLGGEVRSRRERDLCEKFARSTRGVHRVRNGLRIRSGVASRRRPPAA